MVAGNGVLQYLERRLPPRILEEKSGEAWEPPDSPWENEMRWAHFVQRYCNSLPNSNYACIIDEAFSQLLSNPDKKSNEAEQMFKQLIQHMTTGPLFSRPSSEAVVTKLDEVVIAEAHDRDNDKRAIGKSSLIYL